MGTVHIVYSKRSGIPRRVIVADDGEFLPVPWLHEHEAYIEVFDIESLHPLHLRHLIATHKGIDQTQIPSGRCAVVDDTGLVLAIIMADPDIDNATVYDGARLILSDHVNVGERLLVDWMT